MSEILKPPFPWFGGKRRVAHIAWRAFGDVPNYVEPFLGSAAVLLGRPHAPRLETVNDINCYVANFYRAVIASPEEVARYADEPVNEAELHARHAWLVDRLSLLRERTHADVEFYDAKIAGWWVWGICAWIGTGWCDPSKASSRQIPLMSAVNTGGGIGVHGLQARLPALGHSGRGVHSPERAGLTAWFGAISTRMRRVRVACGDWSRVVSGAITGASNKARNMGMSPCAIFLDPPYIGEESVYAEGVGVAAAVHKWAIENGDDPNLRIALCGYAGDFEMPPSWREHAWKAQGGYANRNGAEANENARRERIWFSPHCLPIDDAQTSLFGRTA